ncbi:MAG: hypothetical protein VX315_04135, partial [Pseudomonadota bacterium]|nr:hypothetical protein [Pseudomonadota bacterium]
RQFKEAAEAFLAGYTTYQQSTKAPDSLLKLGMTLAAMGEKKTSCDAYKDWAVKCPQAPLVFAKRVNIEKARVGCASLKKTADHPAAFSRGAEKAFPPHAVRVICVGWA